MLNLSYGSNLNLKQMEKRCPHSKVYGKGILKGYRLLFKGKENGAFLTIVPHEGSQIPVGIWDIDPRDIDALDHYEDYPSLYGKEDLQVEMDTGETISAMAYVMNDKESLNRPSEEYHQAVLNGYKDFGFDPKYIEEALKISLDPI